MVTLELMVVKTVFAFTCTPLEVPCHVPYAMPTTIVTSYSSHAYSSPHLHLLLRPVCSLTHSRLYHAS